MRAIAAGVLVVIAIAGGRVFSVPSEHDVELFKDDFSRFAPGMLSAPLGQLNGAIQEYHYIEHRGVPTSCFAETPYFAEGFTVVQR